MNQINIPKIEILAEVRKTTQYIGSHTHMQTQAGTTDAFESVGAIDENEEILWRFVCEAVTEIRSKAIKASATDVEAPEIDGLEESLRPYLIYAVTYKWLMLGNVVNDRMPLYRELYTLHLGMVRQKVGGYERGQYVDPSDESNLGSDDVPVYEAEAAEITDEGEEEGEFGGVNVPVYDSNGTDIADEGEELGEFGGGDTPVITEVASLDEAEEQAEIGNELPQWFGCEKGVYHRQHHHHHCE